MVDDGLSEIAERLGFTGIPDEWHRGWRESADSFLVDGANFLGEEEIREFDRIAPLPGEALDELLVAARLVREDPELVSVVWHCSRVLYRSGSDANPFGQYMPDLSGRLGGLASHARALVLISGFRDTKQAYAERGIPDRVLADTLADFSLWMVNHREKHGAWGLDSYWLYYHFSLRLFRLGRLQFCFARFHREIGGAFGIRKGDPVLEVHVPQGESLSSDRCDESLREAESFFSRYFPETDWKAFTCESWLLDPQLAELVPPTSNIVLFQRKFEPYSLGQEGDTSFFERVFGFAADRSDMDLLPRETGLQRAVFEHMRSGGRLYDTGGFILRRPGIGTAG